MPVAVLWRKLWGDSKVWPGGEEIRPSRQAQLDSLGYGLAGRVHMRRKEHAKALEAFKKTVQSDPSDARASDHLTLALYASGQTEAAFARAREQASADPLNLVAGTLVAI